jgi:iron complex outermembrane receptor protein
MPTITVTVRNHERKTLQDGQAFRVGAFRGFRTLAVFAACAFLLPTGATAQQPPLTTTLPPITVTAQKEPQDPQGLPVSVTAVLNETLFLDALTSVSQAGWFAPNTFFNEFTARKLSNPRMRGIGASPSNPGVTSYIDGVPQLHANSSSIELVDVDQIEFVRGPQSALFGRNALGGIINITSARPSLQKWSGSLIAPYGSYNAGDVRGAAGGPLISDKLSVGIGFGYSRRDGFTKNDVTGRDLDSRSAVFGKGQILWKPTDRWEARAMLSGERARDGDYALSDLAALRARPFHTARDFEGFTHRDVVSRTVHVAYSGPRIDFSTVTGFLNWTTNDLTDLDYTTLQLITRQNDEKDFQFTEEARVSSAKAAPITISDRVMLRWQAGVFVFTQNYEQDAVNTFSPFVLSQFINFPVGQHSPHAELDDRGLGAYGQATLTLANALDLVLGARADREHKAADLNTFFTPAIAPPVAVNTEKDFSDVSPQFAAAYRVAPKSTVYGTVGRGFKAGGFNAASPAGAEAYDQEHSWNYEAGIKTSAFADRLSASVAGFFIDWSDLQVNIPNVLVPGQFFIGNTAGATSRGVEFELHARPDPGLDLFGGAGFTRARFSSGSVSNGVDVSGNRLANAPRYTADFGVQYSRPVRNGIGLVARAEAICYGDYKYDDANIEGQSAYTLTNLRAGLRGKVAFGEVWIRNAFDTRYIPVAFPYPGLAPSGFIGETGAPRTFGVRVGVSF